MKVGDRVLVMRNGAEFEDTPEFRNLWVAEMDYAVGEVYTIQRINEAGVYFDTQDFIGVFGFPPQVLEVIA